MPGPISAFTAPHGDPAMDAALIDYVSTFVPNMSGEYSNPHVSTGVAPKEYLDKMLAEPFENFTFSPAGAAVYHLGPFGTAERELKVGIYSVETLFRTNRSAFLSVHGGRDSGGRTDPNRQPGFRNS